MTVLDTIFNSIKRRFPDATEVTMVAHDDGMETKVEYKTGFRDGEVERTLAGDIVAVNIEDKEGE